MTVSVRWLDHTAIAVHSIEAALPLYRDLLGGDPEEIHHNEQAGFSVLQLRYPHGGGIELIQPYGPSGFLHDFLAKRGEGVHHITFLVNDLRAAVAEARAAGVRVVDENYDNPRWFEAFISPRSANGTIVQLAQTDDGFKDPMQLCSPHAFPHIHRPG
ncbi:MAG: VOC family protein [Chloroflexi bacterium]|nr:VOC family protein [Chloroflexota bacterium]